MSPNVANCKTLLQSARGNQERKSVGSFDNSVDSSKSGSLSHFSSLIRFIHPKTHGLKNSFLPNRNCNKIVHRDWFSARLFVTLSARDHVGQLRAL